LLILKECVFVNSALKTQCHFVKNTDCFFGDFAHWEVLFYVVLPITNVFVETATLAVAVAPRTCEIIKNSQYITLLLLVFKPIFRNRVGKMKKISSVLKRVGFLNILSRIQGQNFQSVFSFLSFRI